MPLSSHERILWDTGVARLRFGSRRTTSAGSRDCEEAAMAKTKTTTHPWDITRYLESDEDIAAYVDAALEEDDPALVAAALDDVALHVTP